MAYTEKLLPVEALFASWQNRRQNEMRDDSAAKERERLQNEMMKQQLESGKWQLQKEKDQATASMVPDKTAGMLTGEFGNFLSTRQPLSQMPGYVTGTNPAQYQAEQAAIRNTLAQGGGVSGGGGPSEAETNLMNQQAGLAEEQSRKMQYDRQGYGSSAAQKLAEMKIANETKVADNREYDKMIGGLKDESKSRWQDISAGDKMIANTKSIGNEMKSEIDESKKMEGDFANSIYKNKKYIRGDEKLKSKVEAEIEQFKKELADRNIIKPTDAQVSAWLDGLKE